MDVTASMVKALRDKTGLSMMDCKKALVEASGDESRAIEIMREKGLAKIDKMKDREAGEGRVAIHYDPERRRAAIVEVRCETAPVANTDDFIGLVREVARHAALADAPTAESVRDVKLRDVLIAMGACTDSGVNRMRFGGYDFAPIATFSLVQNAVKAAQENNVRFHVGNIFSADLFYTPDPDMFETMAKYDVLGVEMEAAGIYPLAAEHGVEALAICTVSDDIRTGDALSSDERQTTFDEMITVALETVKTSGPVS